MFFSLLFCCGKTRAVKVWTAVESHWRDSLHLCVSSCSHCSLEVSNSTKSLLFPSKLPTDGVCRTRQSSHFAQPQCVDSCLQVYNSVRECGAPGRLQRRKSSLPCLSKHRCCSVLKSTLFIYTLFPRILQLHACQCSSCPWRLCWTMECLHSYSCHRL